MANNTDNHSSNTSNENSRGRVSIIIIYILDPFLQFLLIRVSLDCSTPIGVYISETRHWFLRASGMEQVSCVIGTAF